MNIFRLLLMLLCSLIILVAVNQYFFCPRYSFKPSLPFSGNSFYNPYDSVNENNWIQCNFHAHSNAWKGFTNGKGTAADIYHVYDSMNYSVYCVSDYQRISAHLSNAPGYIPAYEHGYNITKTHQLVLGSKKVLWLDYIFPQTLSNKQHILNLLSSDSGNVVILNHPSIRNGYAESDFKYLTNYNCMEVLNCAALSLSHWDAALSCGKPVFIAGNDDLHNVFSPDLFGKMCTWVNVSGVKKAPVLNALATGKSYGMIIGDSGGNFPKLKQFSLTGDTLYIEMNKTAKLISFIGQNGQTLATTVNTLSTAYIIKPEDHYIRTEIVYPDGTSIFLNPVFRYDKTKIEQTAVSVNIQKTFVFRLTGILLLTGSLTAAFLFVLSKPNRQRIRHRLFQNKTSRKTEPGSPNPR